MDSGIIVVIVLTALAVGAFAWLEIISRRKREADEKEQAQGKGNL